MRVTFHTKGGVGLPMNWTSGSPAEMIRSLHGAPIVVCLHGEPPRYACGTEKLEQWAYSKGQVVSLDKAAEIVEAAELPALKLDLVGRVFPEATLEEVHDRAEIERLEELRKTSQAQKPWNPRLGNRMVTIYGAGPTGAKCKTCEHLGYSQGHRKRFYKCALRGRSRGEGTDHRVNWPACSRHKERATC